MDRALSTGLPAPGERISGKYDVVRVVGEGGMGIVYEVVHTRLQQRAAIKMLQPRVQAMPDVAARFEREARAACRLKSRHAVRITDVDHDEAGRAYMVMEFLEGHDLAQELHERGRLPVVEAVDIVLQSCAAMAEAHGSGVVHRDLKPSNLFLVDEGGERIVKVLDFGISKMTTDGEEAVTSTFATMGTPLYMSPEQIRSTKNVDGRTDIWSLGVLLYEALGGQRPFQGTTTAAAAAIVSDEPSSLRELAPDVSVELEAVVMRTLAKKVEDRYPDVRALAEALAPFGSSPDALRVVEASAAQVRTSYRAGAKKPSSTPSFVHAKTVEQTTPPGNVAPRLAELGLASGVAKTVLGAPLTEAVSATLRASSSRRWRAGTRIGVALLVAGAVWVGIVIQRRADQDHAPATLPSAAATVAIPGPLPPLTASPALPADPSARPSLSSPSSSASAQLEASASAATPPPSKARAPRPRPVSSSSPPSASPPPATPHPAAPAPTNPLHL